MYVAEKNDMPQYLQQFFLSLVLERGAIIDYFQSYQWILETFTNSLNLLLEFNQYLVAYVFFFSIAILPSHALVPLAQNYVL